MKDYKTKDSKRLHIQSELGVDIKNSGSISASNNNDVSAINTGTASGGITYDDNTTNYPPINITPSTTPNVEDYLNTYSEGVIYNANSSGSVTLNQAQIRYTDQDMREVRDTIDYQYILLNYADLMLAYLKSRGRLVINNESTSKYPWYNEVNAAAQRLANSIASAWGHGYPAFKAVKVFSNGTFEIIAMI